MNSHFWSRISALVALPFLAGCGHFEKCCGGRAKSNKASGASSIKENHMKQEVRDYPSISRSDLLKAMETGNITVIDANGTESFLEGHIPGAIDFEGTESTWPATLPEDRKSPIVAYCGGPRCMAWKSAATRLSDLGYQNVSHYPGGLMGWTEEGMTLVTSSEIGKSTLLNADNGKKAIPNCTLTPKAQASRISELQSNLFKEITSVTEGPGSLRMQFADKPQTVVDLTEFIRFERKCCSSLKFNLEWGAENEPLILEIRGQPAVLATLKEIAESK